MAGLEGVGGPAINAPSILTYGPQTFQIERVTLWDSRPVYDEDGTTRLYLHHRIGIQAVWSPVATRTEDGLAGLVSIARIREQVLTPRQLLVVRIANEIVLQSPASKNDLTGPPYYSTDGKNGPNPIALNVVRILGTHSVIAYFEVETWLTAPCPENRLCVLSHRWETSQEISEDYYTTRSVRGWATFRTDRLIDQALLPDDFRGRLFHPIPPNVQRKNVSVTASSDGTGLSYSFSDVEQPTNLIGGATSWITRLAAVWGAGMHRPNWDGIGTRYVSFHIEAWAERQAPRI